MVEVRLEREGRAVPHTAPAPHEKCILRRVQIIPITLVSGVVAVSGEHKGRRVAREAGAAASRLRRSPRGTSREECPENMTVVGVEDKEHGAAREAMGIDLVVEGTQQPPVAVCAVDNGRSREHIKYC